MDALSRNALVSIPLATYNGERFLRQQLDSIYDQTWDNFEVIAADDCSSDGTVEILEEYHQRHGLVYSVNGCNLGFVRNFEQLLGRCSGDFIALADQDDIWLPNKVTKLVEAIGDASLVYSDAVLIDAIGKELPGSLLYEASVRLHDGKPFKLLVCNTCVTGCTVLFRQSLLAMALPIPSYELYHDWWLAVSASRMSGIRRLDECLILYRQHEANDTGAHRNKSLWHRIIDRLSPQATNAKQCYYHLLQNRANGYLSGTPSLNLTREEIVFLEEIGRYAENRIYRRNRLETVRLMLRHRNSLFPGASLQELCIYMLGAMLL